MVKHQRFKFRPAYKCSTGFVWLLCIFHLHLVIYRNLIALELSKKRWSDLVLIVTTFKIDVVSNPLK